MKRNITGIRKSVQNYQSAVSAGDRTCKQGEANKDMLQSALRASHNSMHDIGVVLHHLEQPILGYRTFLPAFCSEDLGSICGSGTDCCDRICVASNS